MLTQLGVAAEVQVVGSEHAQNSPQRVRDDKGVALGLRGEFRRDRRINGFVVSTHVARVD